MFQGRGMLDPRSQTPVGTSLAGVGETLALPSVVMFVVNGKSRFLGSTGGRGVGNGFWIEELG